jgi:hypothetical protein
LSSEEAIIESELKGKTLLVYMHMLKKPSESIGVRKVQRDLGFSSPSVSSYHLNKLTELNLVENNYGDYKLVSDIKIGVLKQFITFGGIMLPRYLFYAVLMTTMLVTYLFQLPAIPTRDTYTALIMGVVPNVILWYETIKIWRDRPQ